MYYPKNKIQTNLYTSGNEFFLTEDNSPYTGYYWKTFSGEFFTGKSPDDKPNKKLSFIENREIGYTFDFPQTEIAFVDAPLELTDIYNSDMLINYTQTKNIDLSKNTRKSLPYSVIPQPTKSDYQTGEFRRYFVKKINEHKYIEIDKNTFNNISSRNIDWLWELYQPFFIPWQISGDKPTVAHANRNIVILTSKTLNLYGFDKFLKEDYTKFWKS
jgi:hypothetical protein